MNDREQQRRSNESISTKNYKSNVFGHWVRYEQGKNNLRKEAIRRGQANINDYKETLNNFHRFFNDYNGSK